MTLRCEKKDMQAVVIPAIEGFISISESAAAIVDTYKQRTNFHVRNYQTYYDILRQKFKENQKLCPRFYFQGRRNSLSYEIDMIKLWELNHANIVYVSILYL